MSAIAVNNPMNFNGYEIQNSVWQVLAAAPSAYLTPGRHYVNSTDNHGYLYLNGAFTRVDNYTASELIALIVANDGAGTNIDSDKLDGQEGTYYLARANHTGTQLASTISDFDTQVRTSRLDQMAAPTAAVSMNSQRLTNGAAPASATDFVIRSYVDALVNGTPWKVAVRAASTANVNVASAPTTLDGVTLALNDRLLLKDQTTGSQNGIYQYNGPASALTRTEDADSSAEMIPGTSVMVQEGTTNADSQWRLITDGPITLGTTTLTFTQIGAGTTYSNGTGITIAGNVISIDTAYVGQTSITTLGTISTGTWQGTSIAVAYGGTGATTAAGARTNLGLGTIATQAASNVAITGGTITGITDLAVADGGTGASTAAAARTNLGCPSKYTTLGPTSGATMTITQATHGCAASQANIVQVLNASTGAAELVDFSVASNGDVTITWGSAPTANSYRINIFG